MKLFLIFLLSISSFSFSQGAEESVGRGWAYPDMETEFVGATLPFWNIAVASAEGGAAPENIEPLAHDIFTTNDFYKDQALWSDPRYFRCNSPLGLDALWGNYSSGPRMVIGEDPNTAAWGYCDRDYSTESIVSPYPFATAEEHYEALMDEVNSKGGPTQHTFESLPNWNGRYSRNVNIVFAGVLGGPETVLEEYHQPPQWILGHLNQLSTVVSLLTEEYQKRLVQQLYHQAKGNASQWSLMYCRPEGFMRAWSGPGFGSVEVLSNPERMQFFGGSGNVVRNFQVGREFNMEGIVPRLGPDVRAWFGESVAFWDGENLITWTSNIQGWFTHASWEHSDNLQTIEIYSPRKNDSGELIGLEHEAIFYDPDVFVAPVRNTRFLSLAGGLNEGSPIAYEHCNQTIFPIEGTGRPVTPGATIEYTIPDLFNRPWAKIWEEYFEEGMEQPELDIFNF